MPNNLPLAVAIADASSAEKCLSPSSALAKATDLAALHPDADANADDVAEVLQYLNRNPLD